MNYEKVVFIGKDNPEKSRQILIDLLYNRAYFLFVVLGDNPSADHLVDVASDMAGGQSEPTMVVSIADYTIVTDILSNLQNANTMLPDLAKVLGFTTSIGDAVADVINQNERVDLVRVYKAFQKAYNS